MKIKLIIIPALAALLLTACSPSTDNNMTANDPQTDQSDQTSITAAENADINTQNETFLLGLDNKSITLSDITALTLSDGTELSGNELTLSSFDKGNFSSVECEGFCYLADPLKIGESGGENTENFVYQASAHSIGIDFNRNFKRYNVGDKYGKLTIKKATVFFDSKKYNETTEKPNFDGIFYKDQYIEFEGEATVTGHIAVNEYSDYFPELDGVMELLIDSDSHILPIAVADVSLKGEGGFYTTRYSTQLGVYGGDAEYFNDEYGPVILGSINDVPSDTSNLNTDYPHYNKVKVTINNIKVSGEITVLPSGFSYITAEVKDLEILEQ